MFDSNSKPAEKATLPILYRPLPWTQKRFDTYEIYIFEWFQQGMLHEFRR